MKKKLRSVIITFCVGVIALVSYFVAAKIISNNEGGNTTKTQLTSFSSSEIQSLKIELFDGDNYIITEDASQSSSSYYVPYKVTFTGVYDGVEFDSSRASSIMTNALRLSSTRTLQVDESDYALFGLDKPKSVLTFTKTNGDLFHIYIGAESTTTSSYYCKIDGSDDVYVISSANGRYFTSTSNDLRVKKITPITNVDNIKDVVWQYGENERIHVYRDNEYSIYNPFGMFYVESPWTNRRPVNPELFTEMIQGLSNINISGYITPKADGTEADLSDYGLDKPWGYYRIESIDGKVHEISIGDYENDEEIACYILDHTSNQIYLTYERTKFDFIQKYNALKITSIYLVNAKVDDIASIKITANGISTEEKTYLLDIKKTKKEDSEDYTYEYRLNGMTYREMALPMLYQSACGIRLQHMNKNYEHDDDAILELTYTPRDKDEKVKVFKFYNYNDNYCVVYENDVADVLVSTTAVNALIKAVNVVLEGGIPEYAV